MLLEGHKKFHTMGPKDVKIKATVPLQITRTVSETGEQFTMEVPLYPDDSREDVSNRINFALSVMQDRLEDVNKAVLEAKVKAEKANRARAMTVQVRALEKRLKKKTITQEEFDAKLEELNEKFGDANEALDLEVKTDDEVLSEDPQT